LNAICAGIGEQIGGAAPEQLKFTGLAYPFSVLNVPSNVALWVGNTVSGEFEIAFV
jgi:hypothetical protein